MDNSVEYDTDLAQFVSDYYNIASIVMSKVSDRDIAEAYIESCLVKPDKPDDEWLQHEVESLIPTINYYRN